MHDQLFRDHQSITVGSIKEKLSQYAQGIPHMNVPEFRNCLDSELSLGAVLQVMNLASAYEVTTTPTLFINGRRMSAVKGVEELRKLIQTADAEDQGGRKPKEPGSPGPPPKQP